MDLQKFQDSTTAPEPPEGLSMALQSLWWDAKGDWDKAHDCAQEDEERSSMLVHAYLHRKEGDQANAEYWYRRCGSGPCLLSLEEEWDLLARDLLPE
jgi:hypothetical protein